jgi:hypothetical protein
MSKIKIQAGDVVLSSGSNDFQVRVQNFLGSKWNGVSIVVRDDLSNQLVLLESTHIPICEDTISGKMISGVQVVNLNQKLDRYPGSLIHRSLFPPLDRHQISLLTKFVKSTWELPFNDSPYYAARAVYRRNSQAATNSFFCAELIAAAYQKLGILITPPYGRSANNYIPADFSEEQQLLDLHRKYLFTGECLLD